MATIEELKARLPLPDLLRAMGLGDYAKKLCCSPLRKDNNPSWGIYQDDKGIIGRTLQQAREAMNWISCKPSTSATSARR
jgi:hypothetical protein